MNTLKITIISSGEDTVRLEEKKCYYTSYALYVYQLQLTILHILGIIDQIKITENQLEGIKRETEGK